jgi:hypothetical protein
MSVVLFSVLLGEVLIDELLRSEAIAERADDSHAAISRTLALVDVAFLHHLETLRTLNTGGFVGAQALSCGESAIAPVALELE